MNSYLLQGESDIQLMRDLIKRLPQETTVVDFEETMLMTTVQATTRLWQHQSKVVAFVLWMITTLFDLKSKMSTVRTN